MLYNEMPGVALEAPDTFLRLAAPLWPRLPLALGYTGGARWLGHRSFLSCPYEGISCVPVRESRAVTHPLRTVPFVAA